MGIWKTTTTVPHNAVSDSSSTGVYVAQPALDGGLAAWDSGGSVDVVLKVGAGEFYLLFVKYLIAVQLKRRRRDR